MVGEMPAGGWLIARLVREVADHGLTPQRSRSLAALVAARTELALRDDSTGAAPRVLSLIAAAGVGPVLPIRLLAAALGDAGTGRSRWARSGTTSSHSGH